MNMTIVSDAVLVLEDGTQHEFLMRYSCKKNPQDPDQDRILFMDTLGATHYYDLEARAMRRLSDCEGFEPAPLDPYAPRSRVLARYAASCDLILGWESDFGLWRAVEYRASVYQMLGDGPKRLAAHDASEIYVLAEEYLSRLPSAAQHGRYPELHTVWVQVDLMRAEFFRVRHQLREALERARAAEDKLRRIRGVVTDD